MINRPILKKQNFIGYSRNRSTATLSEVKNKQQPFITTPSAK